MWWRWLCVSDLPTLTRTTNRDAPSFSLSRQSAIKVRNANVVAGPVSLRPLALRGDSGKCLEKSLPVARLGGLYDLVHFLGALEPFTAQMGIGQAFVYPSFNLERHRDGSQ